MAKDYFRGDRLRLPVAALLFGIFVCVSLPLSSEENSLSHTLWATILVRDRESTGDRIVNWAEGVGGFLLFRSEDQINVRFPYGGIEEFITLLESAADQVIEMAPRAMDLREEMIRLESAIRSREEVLARNLSFIDQTDVEGTLEIEREVLRILREIESFKGRLRKNKVDLVLAQAQVSLRLVKQSIPTDLPSSFDWINSIDFYRFVERR